MRDIVNGEKVMSKFESTELSFKHDPKNPELGCIRTGGTEEIDAEIFRQISKAKHDCSIGQGLLPPSSVLLDGIANDTPATQIKSIEIYPADAPHDLSRRVIDCGWGKVTERREKEERHQAAETVSKYFSKIDQGFCFGLGKDNEISKEELVDFLISDESRELTERETADLIKVLKNFEKVRDSESDLGCVVSAGITRGDLWTYAHGKETVSEAILFDFKNRSTSKYDMLDVLNKK